MYHLSEDYETMYKNIIRQLNGYIKRSGRKGLIIGVSGGIDSALCCALASLVDGCRLVGAVIPIVSNSTEETQRGIDICNSFCHEREIKDFSKLYYEIYDTFNY